MKTVAIIAPEYSPCSYPPAHRVRFFENHLESFGWKPLIVSVKPELMERDPDWDYAKMASNDFEVIRVDAFSPSWTRKLGIGDLGIRCFWFMLKVVRRICKSRQIDLLFIPGPPWHTFLIGPIIKREFGIPYVLDYIDPWVSSWGENDSLLSKAYWYRQMAIFLEPFAVKHVDHVVAVSDGTNDGVRKWNPSLKAEQCTGIPYGGEPADFDYLRNNPRPIHHWDTDDGNFHMVYVGAMLPKAYDTLKTLFNAILLLEKEAPDIISKFRIHFIGTTYDVNPRKGLVEPVAEEMGVSKYVSEHPKRVPYLDAINVLCQSDAIFCMGTSEKHYTASKIFPSILARRQLFAAYHEDSNVIDTLSFTGAGTLIKYSTEEPVETKVSEMADCLKELIQAERKEVTLDMDKFMPFTAYSMTSKLSDAFNKAVSARHYSEAQV